MVEHSSELKERTRRRLIICLLAYSLFIGVVCFMPQPNLVGFQTPGIVQYGRLVFLFRPFNSIWSLGRLTSFYQLAWVFFQNLLNVFLLFPLLLGLLFLFPALRSMKAIVLLVFFLSLGIEVTQLVLDWLFLANRVFEIDDLWTNTLGGALAFHCYKFLNSSR